MRSDRAHVRFSMALGEAGLRTLGRLNVPIYRATRGRFFGKVANAPVLLLRTTGRRSGEPRTAPLVYMRDGERYIVIGSNIGSPRAPAWSLNLKANPAAEIELRGERRAVQARIAEGQERAELWRRANQVYSGFDDYDARTQREIAVFVLEPRGTVAEPGH